MCVSLSRVTGYSYTMAVSPQGSSSGLPRTDHWVEVDYNTVNFSLTWTIKNFESYLGAVRAYASDDTLESPELSSGQPGDDLVWRIKVIPGLNGRVDIMIILVKGTVSKVPVTAKISCHVLDVSQQKVQSPNNGTFYSFSVGTQRYVWQIGHSNFYINDPSKSLLQGGNLTLYWEITILRMDKPRITSGKKLTVNAGEAELGHDFGSLLKDGLLSDVTIVAGGKEFKAHKNILSARSPVFRRMFEHDMRESTENRVTIEDISPGAVEEMLTFIYSGQAPNLKKMPVDLLRAAEKYDLKQLKAWSEKELADRLTLENVMETMVLADQLSATELKTVCMDLFTARAGEVVKTEGWAEFFSSKTSTS